MSESDCIRYNNLYNFHLSIVNARTEKYSFKKISDIFLNHLHQKKNAYSRNAADDMKNINIYSLTGQEDYLKGKKHINRL